MAKDSKRTQLFIILTAIVITNAIIAELIGTKIFSLESTLGFAPAQIPLFSDYVLDFNLTAGVVIWPIVFVTTDIINEYFGKNGVKKISFIAVSCIAYVFLVILAATSLDPAEFWLNVNGTDLEGKPFDVDFAFNKIFLQGAGIIIASLVAFLIGQLLDSYVFHLLRRVTGSKMLWVRATGSTLISQLVDSFVVLFVAFYLYPPEESKWPLAQIFSVGVINYIYKFVVAVVLTPLLYVAHGIIDRYLGKSSANEMIEEAAHESTGFF